MTKEQKKSAMQNLKNSGRLTADDFKPDFIFQGTTTELLVKIISGQIDAKELAWDELRARGLNEKGEWIGF